MKPHYLNPLPVDVEDEDAEKLQQLDNLHDIFQRSLNNDWEYYEGDGRQAENFYPHINFYQREGAVYSKDQGFYRVFNSKVPSVHLAKYDSLYFIECCINKMSGGDHSRVFLRGCEIREISGLVDCIVTLEDCNIANLEIKNNINCRFTLVDKRNRIDFDNHKRGIINDPAEEIGKVTSVPANPSGPFNQSDKCGAFAQNEGCKLFATGIKYTTGKPITNNTMCDFVCTECQFTTGEYSLSDNKHCTGRFLKCTFTGNDWIISNCEHCSYLFSEVTASCPHGTRGSKLNVTVRESKMTADKCFSVGNSRVAVFNSTLGGDTLLILMQSEFFAVESTISAGTTVSTSIKSSFSIGESGCKAGTNCFVDVECGHHFMEAKIEAGVNSFVVNNCKTRSENCKIEAGVNAYVGSGGTVVVNKGDQVKAGVVAYTGEFKKVETHDTKMECVDGFKGSFDSCIIHDSKVESSSHPFNGANVENADFKSCEFMAKANVSLARSYQKDVKWNGPVDMFNTFQDHSVGVQYMDIVNFDNVNMHGKNMKFMADVNLSNSTEFRLESFEVIGNFNTTNCSDIELASGSFVADVNVVSGVLSMRSGNVAGSTSVTNSSAFFKASSLLDTSVTGSHVSTEASTFTDVSFTGSTLNLRDGSAANISGTGGSLRADNTSCGGASFSGCTVELGGVSFGSVSLSGSGLVARAGSLGSVSFDGGSAGSLFGPSCSVSSPGGSFGLSAGKAAIVAGDNYFEAIGNNYRRWVKGWMETDIDRHMRTTAIRIDLNP